VHAIWASSPIVRVHRYGRDLFQPRTKAAVAFARRAGRVACAAGALALCGAAASAPVPKAMLGKWYHGPCSHPDETLSIAKKRARIGHGRVGPIVYYPNDDGEGHGAIHWRSQFSVDNFVFYPTHNRIVHNAQGYGFPQQIVFRRCPAF